jgi:hypothetical protein
MQRVSILVFAFTLGFSSPAWSLGSVGVKAGTGLSINLVEPDPGDDFVSPDITPAIFGVTYTVGFLVAEVEVDLLFIRTTTTGGTPSVAKTATNHLSLPVIAKLQMPIIPALAGLQFGLGAEARYHLDAEKGEEDIVFYLPVVLGVDFDVQMARATVELRYAHQMTDSVKDNGTRVHQILFLIGASL